MANEVAISLAGKVAVVTGGGSGIGRGACLAFADAGANIAIIERESDGETVKLLREKGVEAESFEADVSDVAALKKAIDAAADRFGGIDILFANAGINGVWAPIEDIKEDEYDNTMDINLKGTFFTIQAAMPHLRKRDHPSIIVTSSVQGTRMFSNSGGTVYGTTKAGQVAMVKILAPELGPYGIRINAICPGAITSNIQQNTEQRHTEDLGVKKEVTSPGGGIPLDRQVTGDPEQVGRVALVLASNLTDHVTGEVVYVDGGQSLI